MDIKTLPDTNRHPEATEQVSHYLKEMAKPHLIVLEISKAYSRLRISSQHERDPVLSLLTVALLNVHVLAWLPQNYESQNHLGQPKCHTPRHVNPSGRLLGS
ncbi:hypothetical protein THAR02_05234 [Trichoderma harzianum]|uniref:Uncharacterized protein n=1 Tax=Trichoderma harzianum TaxID=5544 RepID=A0A0F9XDG3_TRIHA|nr:hypothetical protein THAR02_05234 [Trichoderma harzianum]